jgi:ribosomal protein S18 acetylase RimI-like enzyme
MADTEPPSGPPQPVRKVLPDYERAGPADFDDIKRVNVAAYVEFAEFMSAEDWSAMRAKLTSVETVAEKAEFWVARLGGQVVGSVAYCPPGNGDLTIFPADWAVVLLLAVLPDCRGRGFAQGLVDVCLRRGGEDGAPVLGLFTSEVMTAARGLYESLGFERDAELPRRYGLRYWRYRLRLGPSRSASP